MFVHHPKVHIALMPKTIHKGIVYHFRKWLLMKKHPINISSKRIWQSISSFQLIQKKDSLNPIINQDLLNRLGYNFLRKNNFDTVIAVFTINVKLPPKSANVYDCFGEGYLGNKDSVNAIINYEKSLGLNFDNGHTERILRKISN